MKAKARLVKEPVMMFNEDPQEPTDYEIIEYYKAKVLELEQALADLLEVSQLALLTLELADTVGWSAIHGARTGNKTQKKLHVAIIKTQEILNIQEPNNGS